MISKESLDSILRYFSFLIGVKGQRSLTSNMNLALYQHFKNKTAGRGNILIELKIIISVIGSLENGRKNI